MKIVLLGSLPKGDDVRSEWKDWKPEYMQAIQHVVPDAKFIHGDSISDNVGAELVVGHDLYQIKRADICVIDAREKIGAGTAQEIVIAKYLRKAVVIVIPPNSHHRKTNVVFHGVEMEEWVHPFLKISSDYVAESIEDAADWIKDYTNSANKPALKDLSVFEDAIKAFEVYDSKR
jgi:hypothetical protein